MSKEVKKGISAKGADFLWVADKLIGKPNFQEEKMNVKVLPIFRT